MAHLINLNNYLNMKNKTKIIRMPLAKTFPATHPRKGEETCFKEKIKMAVGASPRWDKSNVRSEYEVLKLHTCRANLILWKNNISEVVAGNAVLVIYEWNGKPYSKDGTKNLFVFGTNAVKGFIDELLKTEKYKDAIPVINSGIGVQKLEWTGLGWFIDDYDSDVTIRDLSQNDGLSFDDFKAWFKNYNLNEPMAIIQFTKFRY
jgi:hypothetical protein